MNKIKKMCLFWPVEKISVQLNREYYENVENDKIQKIYDNFH